MTFPDAYQRLSAKHAMRVIEDARIEKAAVLHAAVAIVMAQDESRSCSENCRWHIRKQFQDGKPTGGNMLGYRQEKGVFKIIPEEAELVQQIFLDYLSGMGFTAIERKLRGQGVNFSKSAISKLLRNEKYYGSMLLQKTFTLDHISKKKIANKGQMPQFFVQDSHEPIVNKDLWDKVQAEIKRRAEHFNAKPTPPKTYPFTGMIRCGICGAHYRRKITATGSIATARIKRNILRQKTNQQYLTQKR